MHCFQLLNLRHASILISQGPISWNVQEDKSRIKIMLYSIYYTTHSIIIMMVYIILSNDLAKNYNS